MTATNVKDESPRLEDNLDKNVKKKKKSRDQSVSPSEDQENLSKSNVFKMNNANIAIFDLFSFLKKFISYLKKTYLR